MTTQAFLEALRSDTQRFQHAGDVATRSAESASSLNAAELRAGYANFMRSTFSMSEEDLFNFNQAAADKGIAGWLNRRTRKGRQNMYEKMIRKGFQGIRVVSEGDSWFQYPLFVKDAIDWLSEGDDIAIYSLGYGGDWLANMIIEEEYFKAIEKQRPQILLVSGGGNDLLQNGRLKYLLHHQQDAYDAEPARYLKPEFDQLMAIFEYLYTRLYRHLQETWPEVKVICHGYAYAIPSTRRGNRFFDFLSHVATDNGQWLKRPMEARGITRQETQEAIVREMIDRFNVLQQRLAAAFPNVYYLDFRELFTGPQDWHDELHPSTEKFRDVAAAIRARIDEIVAGQ